MSGESLPAQYTISDRERWEAERSDSKMEFDIKYRELMLKEKEATSQSNIQAWKNPLILAIMTAAAAAGGNALVSYIGASQQNILESFKAESARILEVIKTNDTEQAAKNLSFLVETGLVTDSRIREISINFFRIATQKTLRLYPPPTLLPPTFCLNRKKRR